MLLKLDYSRCYSTVADRPLPLLGSNIDYDLPEWTTRLVNSLDFPVSHKILAVGGCEKRLMAQLKTLKMHHDDLTLIRTASVMGMKSAILT